jgi:hypothetical protein
MIAGYVNEERNRREKEGMTRPRGGQRKKVRTGDGEGIVRGRVLLGNVVLALSLQEPDLKQL